MDHIYKKKYIKYKTKYLHMRDHVGGSFDLNEEIYTGSNANVTNIDKIKYIAGPVSLTIINNAKYKKKVYLFGDHHVYTDKFVCDGNATNENTIYLPDYLKYYFDKNKNTPIDLFIELPYTATKNIPIMKLNMIENMRKKFEPCFRLLTDKTECRQEYPLIRFHAMDIRKYLPRTSDNINTITKLYDYITYIKTVLCDEESYNNNKIEALVQINSIKDIIDKTDIHLIEIFKFIVNESTHKTIYDKVNITLKFLVDVNTKYYEKKADIICALSRIQSELQIYYTKTTPVPPELLKTIEKYIGDKNGIYDTIDDGFWNVVESSPKLKKNVGNVVREFFKPEIYHKMNDDHNNSVKNIMKSGNMTCADALWFDGFLSTIYGLALMDVYLLGRMFKTFSPKLLTDVSTPMSADNIIIIAGDTHIRAYINFFKGLDDSEFLYESSASDIQDTIKNPSIRCVNTGNQSLDKLF